MHTTRSHNKRKHIASDTHHDTTDFPTKKSRVTEDAAYVSRYHGRLPSLPLEKNARKQDKDDSDVTFAGEETRQRRFRRSAPQSYLQIKSRALTQRFTVMGRERCGTNDLPGENVTIAGSTGNVYTVKIGLRPDCDCPHSNKGNQCKHIIYVMLRVLKAREEIAYQLALTSSELREVFTKAPPIPSADSESKSSDGNRKPIEGECPICYTEFDPDTESVVYCRSACGNNVHKECMQNWATARSGNATCPMCRSPWSSQDVSAGKVDLTKTEFLEGYRNVASQLGVSRERDYSSYHQPWVSQQFGSYGGSRYRHWH